MKFAAKYLSNNVVEITPDNINTFITENPSVPKALLFSEKKGFPMIYKGLSVEFEVAKYIRIWFRKKLHSASCVATGLC